MDAKEWIEERTCELTEQTYGKDYFLLPNKLQVELYSTAEADYLNYFRDRIDADYRASLEQNLIQGG